MKRLKLGVVGLDGHGTAFTELVNGPGSAIPNAEVVYAMPVASRMISNASLIENTEKVKNLGVEITEDPGKLASGVDGILILHDDGAQHYELVKLFADKGKPVFVDKPLEANVERAESLVKLCREHKCPLFSASSLRFSVELRESVARTGNDRPGSAMTFAPYILKPTMPGWIYYGIHAVEPLYALMGPGCRSVRCFDGEYGPLAIGTWDDNRMGMAKGIVKGEHAYGFTAWREKSTVATMVDGNRLYPQLLKEIGLFINSGVSPVDPEESLEVIAFMEAANRSMSEGGIEKKFGL